MKKLIIIGLICFLLTSLFAKTQVSTQGHDGAITAIAISQSGNKRIVYTGSEDGFLIRWNEDGEGERFQISDDSIKMIAVHPNGNDIAVYETDGLTVNRLSVWNWRTLSKRFASKRIDSTITSLSYTSKGSQIMVGQANVMGIIFIDSMRGTVLTNKIKETAGTITFSQTSASENSSVMYSALGQLIYTDLRSGQRRASFKVNNNLQNPLLFNNDVLFAGVNDNTIYLYESTSGSVIERVQARNPIIASSRDDNNLYYFETDGKTGTLKMIEVSDGIVSPIPVIIKNFTFDTWDTPTTATKGGNTIYIGMSSGELYSVNVNPELRTVAANKISSKVYEKIYDINEFNGEYYFLSEEAIFKSNQNNKNIEILAENSGYTNMITTEDAIYLWSKSKRQAVKEINLVTNTETILFSPTNSIEMLRLEEDRLLMLEGSNKVSLYHILNKELTSLYTSTGIQDALLHDDDVYVAKTSASNPQSSLIQVNIETRETTPINISAEVSFSLTEGQTTSGAFYGASIVTENSGTTTKIFSYNPITGVYSIILSLADEDPEAFTYLMDGVLYTNVGRTQIYKVNIQRKQLEKLETASSLPVKVVGDNSILAVLNKDGSVSWYDTKTNKLLKNWYISLDGEWLEF